MVARLVVVEGLDGAGKNTLTTALVGELTDRGVSVGRLAFPRYGTLHADLAADALHGGQAGAADSPHAMALLFALDRHAALGELRDLIGSHDVVLLDRYVASNAAYTAARLGPGRQDEVLRWIGELEFDRLGLPTPDLQILLDTPVALAAERAGSRETADPGRTRDRYERDAALQTATGEIYRRLASTGWRSPWQVSGVDPDVRRLADVVVGH
ncbi:MULTISPECIES: dTMP kinase [unclassified Dietzia]|uniref:dTMP kinase n=1 Tax=unclassified Dietzia TaxID=2617939 RepID=UPI000D22B426|nr:MULTISPECIES: dTMP kinase [unclassified Dietzia]AVZ38862.1 thymidylate kinase [Dietzia sp. JS16-p6b]MBB1024766.1 dTMP kinase [Dietzia sp. DQ12-76]MBB1027727.1 dTMP kinase [Dietzia sp. DQ11-38-2]QGW23990.1 thymidylate kinase [Dietzia sp. DQ12-45-1b]